MLSAYGWGLVSGLWAKLLRPKDIEMLLASQSTYDFLTSLENTPYGQDLAGVGPDTGLSEIQARLTGSFKKTYVLITGWMPEKDRMMTDMLMKGLWDLANAKAVLRGRRAGLAGDAIASALNDFGTIPKQDMIAASKAGDDEELAKAMPPGLSMHVARALTISDNMEAERMLDREFLLSMLGKCEGEIMDYVLVLIDVLNLRTLLLAKIRGFDPSDDIIPDGRHIMPSKLAELIKTDRASFVQLLADTPYYGPMQAAMESRDDTPFEAVDIGLSRVISHEMELASYAKPLSVNSSLSYLKKKEDEVRTLKAIAAGKFHGLPEKEIRGLIS